MVALANWVEIPKYCPTGLTSQQLWTSRLNALYYWLRAILARSDLISARGRVQPWDNTIGQSNANFGYAPSPLVYKTLVWYKSILK